MKNVIKLGMSAIAALVIGGSAYAASHSWRHVMPEFVIDVRGSDIGNKAPALMLIYGEEGSDPFREGFLGADQRISECKTVDSLCVSRAARREFSTKYDGPQSLQVRLFNGKGNPTVGGLRWTGSWHPRQVRITCDLAVTDVQRSCAVSEITP